MTRAATVAIVPAYNEAASLPRVLADLRSGAPELDVVVVDDGSTDRTAAVAEEAGATVLRLPFNLGIGGALRAGFRYAVERGYERAVQLDADGQHDVAAIATLLEGLDGGADLVVGSRFAQDGVYEVGRARRGAMGVLRIAVRLVARRSFSDTSSGFRAFSRRMLEAFAHSYPIDYMESVEALVYACVQGFDVVEVPVAMHPRAQGAPSNRRFKLAYHYVRLLLVIVLSIGRRPRLEEVG